MLEKMLEISTINFYWNKKSKNIYGVVVGIHTDPIYNSLDELPCNPLVKIVV